MILGVKLLGRFVRLKDPARIDLTDVYTKTLARAEMLEAGDTNF